MKLFYIILAIAAVLVAGTYIVLRSPVMQQQSGSVIPTNIPKNNYINKTLGISVNVPAGYTTDESYAYQLAPRQTIPGVKFTIPATLAEGTNLSKDSYVSVEKPKNPAECSADKFIDGSHNAQPQTENGMTYSVATAENAGAGNRYEETVFALQGTTCVAVRYVIHYTALQNHPNGIKEFDKTALVKSMDQIRDSLVIQ